MRNKLQFRCECCYDHRNKFISAKDYSKLWTFPEYPGNKVFIRRHNCPRNLEQDIEILATSGKLVLVRVKDDGC